MNTNALTAPSLLLIGKGPLSASIGNVLTHRPQEAQCLLASSHVGASPKPAEGPLLAWDQHLGSSPRHFKSKNSKEVRFSFGF